MRVLTVGDLKKILSDYDDDMKAVPSFCDLATQSAYLNCSFGDHFSIVATDDGDAYLHIPVFHGSEE
jgi:hypothetical protein